MSDEEIVRAWKDRRYRRHLHRHSAEGLPESPAGAVELSDERLVGPTGGTSGIDDRWRTLGCPGSLLGTCDGGGCMTIVSQPPYCVSLTPTP